MAKASFDRISKDLHLPSAEATGARRNELLGQAAIGYERLLRDYSDQPFWCAQAVRSLGNIRVMQSKLDDAIKLYTRVGKQYPGEEWEVVQSWKTAGDLLWDANRRLESKSFYQQLVTRFDKADATSVTKIIVSTAKKRLAE